MASPLPVGNPVRLERMHVMQDTSQKLVKKKRSKKKLVLISIPVLVGVLAGLWYGGLGLMNSRSFQFFCPLVQRVNTDQKVVALTFDDGPAPGTTEKLLQTLAEARVKATFFLIGDQIEKYPALAHMIVAAGHEVGNHSYSHQRMIFKPYSFYQDEIERTDRLIRQAGYQGDIYFRPPFGKKLIGLPQYLCEHQRKTIMWDVEPDSESDVAASTEKLADYTISHAQPGSIVILHTMYESRATSLDAVGSIIKGLQARGYSFKTMAELLAYQHA